MRKLKRFYVLPFVKRSILIALILNSFYLIGVLAGDSEIELIRPDGKEYTDWNISDQDGRIIIDGSNFPSEDTVYFYLHSEERYYLNVSINTISDKNTILFILKVNGNYIYVIPGSTGPGDHQFPFYTGFQKSPLKITGGENASISDFPWQVLVLPENFLCGGSIISEKWVITAAHCLFDDSGRKVDTSDLLIRVGSTNPYGLNAAEYRIDSIIIHENYRIDNYLNDIALLRVIDSINTLNAESIEFVTSSDVEKGVTDPGVLSWVTGWGLTSVDPDNFPNLLQKVQLPIVSNETASDVWGNVPGSFLMAGYADSNKDACSGDSGGPLIVPVNGGYKLAGIVSWGSENCDTYGAYTRVSTYEKWIQEKTGVGDEFKPAVPDGETLLCYGVASSDYSVTPVADTATYEWELSPESAGTIIPNSTDMLINWNENFIGIATIAVRSIVGKKVSSWTEKKIRITENTQLIDQTKEKTACEGEYVSLEMDTDGYLLTYDWYKNDTLIQSGSSNILTYFNSLPENSGIYYTEISGTCGDTVSAEFPVTIHPETRLNSFTEGVNAKIGDMVTLEVEASGHELNYFWDKDGSQLENNGSTLNFDEINTNDIGNYFVKIEGTCGTVVTEPSYLFVNTDFRDQKSSDISVWPTYTNDIINVAFETDEVYEIFIYDLKGSLMIRSDELVYRSKLSLRNLREGLYLMNIKSSSLNETYRIVKHNF